MGAGSPTVRIVTTTDDTVGRIDERWLATTEFLDHDDPGVRRFAETAVGDADDDRTRAVRLFYAVRDGYWYDPYSAGHERGDFRASAIVGDQRSWCVPKSILLTAAARAVGVPARLGFADVRNHLQSEQLQAKMGTDLFVFHGYSEFLLGDRWVKGSAAFNIELCERFGTKPLDFDGEHDALLHSFDEAGNRHMEYVRQRGSYDDFPFDEMTATFESVYGPPDADGGFTGSEGAAADAAFEPPAG